MWSIITPSAVIGMLTGIILNRQLVSFLMENFVAIVLASCYLGTVYMMYLIYKKQIEQENRTWNLCMELMLESVKKIDSFRALLHEINNMRNPPPPPPPEEPEGSEGSEGDNQDELIDNTLDEIQEDQGEQDDQGEDQEDPEDDQEDDPEDDQPHPPQPIQVQVTAPGQPNTTTTAFITLSPNDLTNIGAIASSVLQTVFGELRSEQMGNILINAQPQGASAAGQNPNMTTD